MLKEPAAAPGPMQPYPWPGACPSFLRSLFGTVAMLFVWGVPLLGAAAEKT